MVIVDTYSHTSSFQSREDFCSNNDKFKFIALEFGLKSMPPLLFYIMGTVRYFSVRDYGVGHANYSCFFKAKVAISISMAFFDVL